MQFWKSLTRPTRIKIFSGIGVGIVLCIAALVYVLVQNAAAQPSQRDYRHLDNQRSAIDTSSEAYDPLLEDFSVRHRTAYMEDFSSDRKSDITQRYNTSFDNEVKLSEQRLTDMEASLALKNERVHTKYQQFARDYRALLGYYKQYKSTGTELVGAISGVCKKVTRLDPGDDDYAKKFVVASDKCLTALAKAKKATTTSAKGMITSLEKMYSARQDAFKKVAKEKNETVRAAELTGALITLLSINSELAQIQSDYEAAETKEYDTIKSDMNASSGALHEVLKQLFENESSRSEDA